MNIIDQLIEYDTAYYAGESPVSDIEYDTIKKSAKKQFPDHPYFKTVGAKIKNTPWEIKQHTMPMGSMDNIPTSKPDTHIDDCIENAIKWWNRLGSPKLMLQPKLDGLSLNLEYENGKLVRAIVRGDGKEGEDILRNVLKMKNVPKEITEHISNIRGEIVLPKSSFLKINQLLEEEGSKTYKNTRNSSAGIARRYDGKYSEYLEFIPFDVISKAPYEFDNQLLVEISSYCTTIKYTIVTDVAQLKRCYLSGIDKRKSLPFAVDGMVIKVNDMSLRKDTSLRPNWIRAMKFPPEENRFPVDNISFGIGKTGAVTPVLENEIGVQFQDKIVNRCTLHNYNQFKIHSVAKGDMVSITISGDVIPKVINVVERSGNPPFNMLEKCLFCGTTIIFTDKEAYCDNTKCPGRIEALINAHVKVMGIDEVGEKLVSKLLTAGKEGKINFSDYADLYTLTKEDILKIDGYANRSAEIVINNIAKAKTVGLSVFIASLGIPDIGDKTIAKTGAKSLEQIQKMSITELESKAGIGHITASAIVYGIKEFDAMIIKLIRNGVIIIQEEDVKIKEDIFKGKSFCFTGDIPITNPDTNSPYTRKEFQAFVEKFGGVNKTGVSKKLDILVMADPNSTSTKAKKAKDMGVELWSCEKFLQAIKEI